MAISIPRYSQRQGKVPQITAVRNTTQASGALADVGKGLMTAVESYANITTQIDADLRATAFENQVKLNGIKAEGEMNLKLQEYEQNQEWSKAGTWAKGLDEFNIEQRKKFKKTMNEQEFAAFEPTLVANEMNGKVLVRKHARAATIKQSQYVVAQGEMVFKQSLEKAETVSQVVNALINFTGGGVLTNKDTNKGTYAEEATGKQKFKAGTFNAGILNDSLIKHIGIDNYNTKKQATLDAVNNKIMLIQAGGTSDKIASPDGGQEINHKKVYKNLKNPEFKILDIAGNEVTVDDPRRKTMISDYKLMMEGQISNFEKQRTEVGFKTFGKMSEQINGILLGQKLDEDGIALPSISEMAKRINNDKDITQQQKDALTKALVATVNNRASGNSDTWDSDQAKKFQIYATALVNSGFINTKKEQSILTVGMINGYLSPDMSIKLIGLSDKVIKEQSDYKDTMMTNAYRTLFKSIGVKPEVLAAMNKIKERGGKIDMAVLSSMFDDPLNIESYTAMNQLNQVIEDGLRKGITLESMLASSANDKNNVLSPIINLYKANISDLKNNDLKFQIETLLTRQAGDKSDVVEGEFRFNPEAYLNQAVTGTVNPVVPQMQEGESIADYFTRIGTTTSLFGNNTGVPNFGINDNSQPFYNILGETNITPEAE